MHDSLQRSYRQIVVEVGLNLSENAKQVLHQCLRPFVRQMAR
jgi:hypothetical protein